MNKFIEEIRIRLSHRMNKEEFVVKNFRHPVSNKMYIIKYENGFMKIKRKIKNSIEITMNVDGFLYFWLEDENYKEVII